MQVLFGAGKLCSVVSQVAWSKLFVANAILWNDSFIPSLVGACAKLLVVFEITNGTGDVVQD